MCEQACNSSKLRTLLCLGLEHRFGQKLRTKPSAQPLMLARLICRRHVSNSDGYTRQPSLSETLGGDRRHRTFLFDRAIGMLQKQDQQRFALQLALQSPG